MTSNRNLGPILAIGGLVVVAGAVIAGFIAVGGPGDARDQRLDSKVMERLSALSSEAQCAFAASGKTYDTVAKFKSVADQTRRGDRQVDSTCGFISPDVQPSEVGTGENPEQPGDITYASVDANHIRLCGNFRRAYRPEKRLPDMSSYMGEVFPEFAEARPAGKHCYRLEMLAPIPVVDKLAPAQPAPPT